MRFRWILFSGLVFAIACQKSAPDNNNSNSGNSNGKVVKLEQDGDQLKVNYRTDGKIDNMVVIYGDGSSQTYQFSYNGDLLNQVDFGGKWKYYYSGTQLTKVETYNLNNVIRYRYDYTYTNNKVSSCLQTLINGSLEFPFMKISFEYNADGNVQKKTVFQYINQQWKQSEAVTYEGFDTHANVLEPFENLPYLPADMYSPNNPVKETWLDDQGTVNTVVTHQYSYDDQSRIKNRKSLFHITGFPDSTAEIKVYY